MSAVIAKTNYVSVKNPGELEEILAPLDIRVQVGKGRGRRGKVCFISATPDGKWPCAVHDPGIDREMTFSFEAYVAPNLEDGEVVLAIEPQDDDSEDAVAVAWDGRSVACKASVLFDFAAKSLGVPKKKLMRTLWPY